MRHAIVSHRAHANTSTRTRTHALVVIYCVFGVDWVCVCWSHCVSLQLYCNCRNLVQICSDDNADDADADADDDAADDDDDAKRLHFHICRRAKYVQLKSACACQIARNNICI